MLRKKHARPVTGERGDPTIDFGRVTVTARCP